MADVDPRARRRAGADVYVAANGQLAVDAALAALGEGRPAMAADRQACLDAGCDGCATKPIDRAKLIGTIRGLVPESLEVT